jgi:hypothetical protein
MRQKKPPLGKLTDPTQSLSRNRDQHANESEKEKGILRELANRQFMITTIKQSRSNREDRSHRSATKSKPVV